MSHRVNSGGVESKPVNNRIRSARILGSFYVYGVGLQNLKCGGGQAVSRGTFDDLKRLRGNYEELERARGVLLKSTPAEIVDPYLHLILQGGYQIP